MKNHVPSGVVFAGALAACSAGFAGLGDALCFIAIALEVFFLAAHC